MEYLFVALVALVVLGALYLRANLVPVTVFDFERGLKYRKGRLERTLDPGRHWIYRPHTLVTKVDIRPRFVSLTGQEVLSSDGVTLRVTIAAQYRVSDPEKAINEINDADQGLYLSLQFALREIIGQAKVEEVLARRQEFGPRVMELTSAAAESLGFELLRVNLKDIMFPGDLKKIFAQVVQAQKEGQAALEKARGETAALRNLANAARMISDNPNLMQLRLLQQLAGSSGNTVVLGFPTSGSPLPIRDQASLPDKGEDRPDDAE
jgi:regulator of protease activity HflC (stomatin/prohibitin superfamily)